MTIVTRTYESIGQLCRTLKAGDSLGDINHSITNTQRQSWCLNTSLDSALSIGCAGGHWPEGAKNLLEATVATNQALSAKQATLADLEVVGHTLDVGEYLAGNPCCWEADGEEEADSKPVVSIGANCCFSAGVDASVILNRGAAILSYVDALEAAGFRVELWSMFACSGGGVQADVRTLVKGAHESWSPSAVAFALCHPAFLRRVMFRHYETDPDLLPMICGGSYGKVLDAHLFDSEGNVAGLDLYIPGIFISEGKGYATPQKAIETVGKAVSKMLAGKGAEWHREAAA